MDLITTPPAMFCSWEKKERKCDRSERSKTIEKSEELLVCLIQRHHEEAIEEVEEEEEEAYTLNRKGWLVSFFFFFISRHVLNAHITELMKSTWGVYSSAYSAPSPLHPTAGVHTGLKYS